MYKIIFFAYVPDDMECSHNFGILEESFESRKAAVKFLKEVEAPRLLAEIIDDDDPINFDVEVKTVGEYEVNITLYSYDEINSITEYKIESV